MNYLIDKKVRLIELFAGIGSQAKALENLGVDFEHYRVIEFDKYAVASYNAIHYTNFEPMDITKTSAKDLGIEETDRFCYIMTYSFPCQDLSIAGKQRGMTKGAGTRSGLLWEVERLLNECDELPQILLMENVKQVISEKNLYDFRNWISFLLGKGYSSFYNVLNATEYGIPQNRERCFMISILGNYEYHFPKGFKLTRTMKDFMDETVDQKYYLSDEQVAKLKINNLNSILYDVSMAGVENYARNYDDVCPSICARDFKDPRLVNETALAKRNANNAVMSCAMRGRENGQQLEINSSEYVNAITTVQKDSMICENGIKMIGMLDMKGNEQIRRVYSADGISPTLQTMQGGNRQPKIVDPVCLNPKGGRNGIDGLQPSRKDRVYDSQAIAATIATSEFYNQNYALLGEKLRIRKLTPKECWRLMGFDDDDFERAEKVNSNSQLYKQAGNSIVVDVLEHIFFNLFNEAEKERQISIFEYLDGMKEE